MSLTVALALFGAAVLAAMAGHLWWQARRARPRRVLPPQAEAAREPGLAGEGIEPSFDAPAAGAEAGMPPPELRPARRSQPRLDALIDAIATLSVEVQISGEMALTHLPTTHRAGSKPFFIEGLNALSKEWEPPAAGQRYGEFQAGVQLANRGGALNEIEYSEFVQKVEAFAEDIGAMADFPDMLEVVARARELDTFAGEHDAQLAVHLRSRSVAWSVGFIQQHAARHGFVPGMVPGRLVLPGAEEGAPPVLTLAFDSQAALADDPNQAALRDVTLAFDVPQTDPSGEPFVAWQASAQALSLGMDAAIVDDNGNALAPESFDIIGSELKTLYDALEARGLPAGSAAARRLFN
ncbi:cell division protein FtsZ [Piscinibacter sp.]|uniref:cell division protein FtsZ n=1 Tax=Piscinibacter sp. TaxID=1903157 RepID=UPI0039E2B797